MVHPQAHFLTIFNFITNPRLSSLEKDLEILILRQQLTILKRKLNSPIKPNRIEKMTLAVLTNKIKKSFHQSSNKLRDVIRIFQPETVLRWHRELVRKKWTFPHKNKGGRPSINKGLENVVLRLARENPRWGYGKIQGELIKLSFKISQSTVRNILDRHGIQPAPVRNGSIGWRKLMDHYKEQILACDFFTIETIWLQTIYVLFFIELGSRRVHFAGITINPNEIWVTQQARQLVWELSDRETPFRFLIHDNDCSFSKAFDAVFESEGFYVIHTPFKAPNANAFSERWLRTAREECLDHVLILNVAHLRRVMIEFADYYNSSRPHQGIDQQTPIPSTTPKNTGSIQCRKVLGGIIHDYYRSPTRAAISTA
ncbi:MAG: integrase core domain-containing protein [Anaerolineales bacterium]|nr:integrase core domain-containing protein [Anaerolineales bacterium]